MPDFNLWMEVVNSVPRDMIVDDDSRRRLEVYLKNTTKFSRERIAEILQFSMPPDMPDFDATITNRFADHFRGVCYQYGCLLHERPHKPLVIARVNPNEAQFPFWIERGDGKRSRAHGGGNRAAVAQTTNIRRRGYISTWLRSPEECLVYVLAHELRHLWQRDYKNNWVFGAKGKKSSERDADSYAIRKLRQWRRKNEFHETEMALERAGSFLFSMLKMLVAALAAKYRRADFT
jgi:hypothetical protein